jgi:hypothetical protein
MGKNTDTPDAGTNGPATPRISIPGSNFWPMSFHPPPNTIPTGIQVKEKNDGRPR